MLRFALATGSTKTAVLVFAWTIRSFLASIVWDAAHPVRSAIAAAVRTRIAAFAPMNPPVGLVSGAPQSAPLESSGRLPCSGKLLHRSGYRCWFNTGTRLLFTFRYSLEPVSFLRFWRNRDASERAARRPRLERRNERRGHVPRPGACGQQGPRCRPAPDVSGAVAVPNSR